MSYQNADQARHATELPPAPPPAPAEEAARRARRVDHRSDAARHRRLVLLGHLERRPRQDREQLRDDLATRLGTRVDSTIDYAVRLELLESKEGKYELTDQGKQWIEERRANLLGGRST
jgi:hypothetical protein